MNMVELLAVIVGLTIIYFLLNLTVLALYWHEFRGWRFKLKIIFFGVVLLAYIAVLEAFALNVYYLCLKVLDENDP